MSSVVRIYTPNTGLLTECKKIIESLNLEIRQSISFPTFSFNLEEISHQGYKFDFSLFSKDLTFLIGPNNFISDLSQNGTIDSELLFHYLRSQPSNFQRFFYQIHQLKCSTRELKSEHGEQVYYELKKQYNKFIEKVNIDFSKKIKKTDSNLIINLEIDDEIWKKDFENVLLLNLN